MPRLITISDDDAGRFACNAVVVGRQVVLNQGSKDTEDKLLKADFVPHPVDVSEFIKAGGSCKCLTLELYEH